MADTVKVYISMPREFLEKVDLLAETEHLSRSALIREAMKVYMDYRSAPSAARFFQKSEELRQKFAHLDEDELGSLIDETIAEVRSSRGS